MREINWDVSVDHIFEYFLNCFKPREVISSGTEVGKNIFFSFFFFFNWKVETLRKKIHQMFLGFFSRSQGSAAFNQPSAVSVLQGQLEEGNDLLRRFQEGKLRGK